MWYQLQIEHCHRDEVELLSELLEESGALSITLTDKNDDPILEPEPGTTPLWPNVVMNALYDDEIRAMLTREQLQASHPDLQTNIHTLPPQDWERAWMDDFKPQQFGQRLWVCPSWLTPPEPDAINLILDPGLAFGTGTHPTTSLCLTWLGNSHSLQNKTVIDYGCGSGILALAALKLGATFVHAVDIDPQALQATHNNAEVNHIINSHLSIDYPDTLTTKVDLLMANILLGPLTSLQNRFQSLLKPKGTLVVSGILSDQVEGLLLAYEEHFNHQSTYYSDGWAMVEFVLR